MRYAMAALGAVLGLAALLASCGGADICLGCDGNTTPSPQTLVTVQGNLIQVVNPPTTFQSMQVIVCTDDPNGPLQECENSVTGPVDSSGNFTVTRARRGSLRIGFWLNPPNGSGSFDPDTPFA